MKSGCSFLLLGDIMNVSSTKRYAFICFLLVSIAAGQAYAGSSLTIFPSTILMTTDQMSGSVKLQNNGDNKMSVQLEIFQWTQSPEIGTDSVELATDVVMFPKIVSIEGGKEQVIRIGNKNPSAGDRERAYRISVRELPSDNPQSSSTGARMMLNLSAPMFLSPRKPQKRFEIAQAALKDGKLLVTISNAGNSYVKMQAVTAKGIDASGQETFAVEKAGWYVLAGVSHVFTLEDVPAQKCQASQSIKITASVEQQLLPSETLDIPVDAGQCP